MNRYLTLALVAAAVCAASCHRNHESASGQAERVDVALPVVDSVTLYKTYPGVLSANREVQLVARVNGYLESKNYKSGDYVRKGTVLFTIESGNYRDAVDRARSALESAEASLEYARKHYEALSEALKSDAVSRMEVEQGHSAFEECKAEVLSARAALKTAETQLSYCTICAPFDGHVSSPVYDVGAYVGGEGMPVELASIYEDAQILADFSVDDAEAMAGLQKNIVDNAVDYRHIPVKFSENPGHSYTASLDYMSPQVNTSTGTLQLQATIDNPYGELRSGMLVSIDLPVGNEPHAVLVRDAALSTDQLGKYLYVVNDSDRVVYTPVIVGDLVGDSMRIVKKGIGSEDRYVTRALLKVRDGMTVEPVSGR